MISVIIPAYNAERFLQACVDSVVGQTARDWEMVIVDDGSTDSTPGICDRAAAGDPRIRVVHKPNGGLSDARNAGIDAARGDRLFFLDADDAVAPTLSRAFRLWPGDTGPTSRAPDSVRPRRRSPEVVAGQPRRNVPRPGNGRGDDALPGQAQPFRVRESSMTRASSTACASRKGTWYEDLDLFYRVFLRASRVAFTPRPLYFYRSNPSSFLHSFSLRRADALGSATGCAAIWRATARCGCHVAARDRRLSAAFNVYEPPERQQGGQGEKMARKGHRGPLQRDNKGDALGSLRDPRVRRKNKVGILASYLGGFPLLRLLSRFVYR